jgi:glutamine kinase
MINEECLKLESKARTLNSLSNKITKGRVLPIIFFTAREYFCNKENILEKISDLNINLLIVRSSGVDEDSDNSSKAGEYDSLLNVENIKSKVEIAIEKVLHSYHEYNDKNEVLVQPMLLDVVMSGVVFTADLDTLSPYYIINYDQKSGSTESVTSGNGRDLETFIAYKNSKLNINNRINSIIDVSKECELLFHQAYLDIEFAIDSDEQVYVFQVRPLVKGLKEVFTDVSLDKPLYKISKKIRKLNSKHPNLLGDFTLFGVMSDWNPAEILGIRPKKLSISLYKELITDDIWAYQRSNYGYRNLISHPLMVTFMGIPYIDVRVSFNSFIPNNLDETIASKLSNYYLSKLIAKKHLHDKVEFEVLLSCYTFDLPERIAILKESGFTDNELKRVEFSLLELTNKIIKADSGYYKQDLKKIETLRERYTKVNESDLSTIDKIYWLIKDCKQYGTLPFAGIARAAFIAISLLKSLVNIDVINESDYEQFLGSLRTVSGELSLLVQEFFKDDTLKSNILEEYGHLRPGTYDILSKRYDEDFDYYFSLSDDIDTHLKNDTFTFSDIQIKKISQLLITHGYNIDVEKFLIFLAEAIEGREYAKLVFTKSLSRVLTLLESLGDRFNISKEEIAHLDIQDVLNLYSDLNEDEISTLFMENIKKNKIKFRVTQAIKLPSLITSENDIYHYFLDKGKPNFISRKSIQGLIVCESEMKEVSLDNKIVLIKSADPGYDYLFSKGIIGLITQFGGANSHMAIRCSELKIPAVIGAGEVNFSLWSSWQKVELDCSNQRVLKLS